MKVKDLTCYKRGVGKFIIYQAGGSKPLAAYVSGVARDGSLRGQYLNSTIMFFGAPKYCIEYSPRLMDRLLFAYGYKEARKSLEENKKRLIMGRYF